MDVKDQYITNNKITNTFVEKYTKTLYRIVGANKHQNTPSLPFCNHQCVFCWRDIELGTLGSEFIVDPDEPKELVDEMIRHHQDIIKNHLPLRRYLDNYEIMIDIMYFMLLNPGKHLINPKSC
ncbi:MAG: hypothetical protein ACTSR5_08090 [Promethearchaeota archaeon]